MSNGSNPNFQALNTQTLAKSESEVSEDSSSSTESSDKTDSEGSEDSASSTESSANTDSGVYGPSQPRTKYSAKTESEVSEDSESSTESSPPVERGTPNSSMASRGSSGASGNGVDSSISSPLWLDPSNYEHIKILGHGSYGQVTLAQAKDTGEFVAIKEPLAFSDELKKCYDREIQVLCMVDHPALLRLIGLLPNNECEDFPLIVTPYMTHGSVGAMIKAEEQQKCPPEWTLTQKHIVLYGIACGMMYMHSKRMIHRDFKPDNVLLDDKFRPKIADFGMAKQFDLGMSLDQSMTGGTPLYNAPERQTGRWGQKADVFSYGVTMYAVLAGRTPYKHLGQIAYYEFITKVHDGERPPSKDVPAQYRSLMEKCWADDPDTRPAFTAIIAALESKGILAKIDQQRFEEYKAIIEPYTFAFWRPEVDANGTDDPSQVFASGDWLNISHFYVDINNFERVKMLGRGSFGKVFLCKEKTTGRLVASKKVDPARTRQESYEREIGVMGNVTHPTLLALVGCTPYSDENPMVIVTEFMHGGSVDAKIKLEYQGQCPSDWSLTRKHIVLYGTAYGMMILHKQRIIHRDMKPDNILLDEHLEPKIADFGLSKYVELGRSLEQSFQMGTPLYMAPEVFIGEKWGFKADVYAFAMTMYAVLAGRQPFQGTALNWQALRNRIVDGHRPEIPSFVSDAYIDLIEDCWTHDPDDRPSFERIAARLASENMLTDINREEFMEYANRISTIGIPNDQPEVTTTEEQSVVDVNVTDEFDDDPTAELFASGQWKDISCFTINVDDYEPMAELGQGSYGKVTLRKDKKTGILVAYKKVEPRQVLQEKYEREIGVMGNMRHPTLLRLIGGTPYSEEESMVIVTEYMKGGSVDDKIKLEAEGQCPPEWNLSRKHIVLYGVAYGMMILHNYRIIHRNMKPENILLDGQLEPKIADFGLSKYVEIGQTLEQTLTQYGTAWFTAPEIFEGQKWGFKADVYAFAMTMYAVLAGRFPFDGVTLKADLIAKVKGGYRPELLSDIPSRYRELLEACWCANPYERLSFPEIVETLGSESFVAGIDGESFLRYQAKIDTHGRVANPPPERGQNYLKIKNRDELFTSFLSLDLNKLYMPLFEDKNQGTIGSGEVANLTRALCPSTGRVVSLKTIECTKDLFLAQKTYEREVVALETRKHRTLLGLYGCVPFDEEKRSGTVITPLMVCSLHDLLNYNRSETRAFSLDDTRKHIILYGIASGMQFLHKNGVIHGNLNLSNVLLNFAFQPKISGFGMSRCYRTGVKFAPSFLSDVVSRVLRFKDDVYAFGVIMYYVLSGRIPSKGRFIPLPHGIIPKMDISHDIPSRYSSLLEQCLSPSDNDRPDFEEIVRLLGQDKMLSDLDRYKFDDYKWSLELPDDPDSEGRVDRDMLSVFLAMNNEVFNLDVIDISSMSTTLKSYNKGDIIRTSEEGKTRVYTHKENGTRICAIKTSFDEHENMVQLMSILHHPTIVKLSGIVLKPKETGYSLTMIMPFFENGTLKTVLESELSTVQKHIILYGIACGMKFLHAHHVMHRDLRPDVIFCDDELHPIISGFWYAIHANPKKELEGVVGTPLYRAPEVKRGRYDFRADVFSYGCVLYEVVTGELPLDRSAAESGLVIRPKIPSLPIKAYETLIERCWSEDLEDRPSFVDICKVLAAVDLGKKDLNETFKRYMEKVDPDIVNSNSKSEAASH